MYLCKLYYYKLTMVYLIAYNINEGLYDYTGLKEYIKSLGSFQHPMNDIWFVSSSDLDVEAEIKNLKSYLPNEKDMIIMMPIQSNNRLIGWMPKAFWQWFKTNLYDQENTDREI